MFKVVYLHVADDIARAPRSGWYVTHEDGTIVSGTPRFEHRASAVRAASLLLNVRVAA